MDEKRSAKKEIITFLILTTVLSAAAYVPLLTAGSVSDSSGGGSLFTLLLMWAPGLAALLALLIYRRPFMDIGWKPGKIKYLLLALAVPVGYGLLSFGAVWLTGLGGFTGSITPSQIGFMVGGLLGGLLSGLGEEIGWRGFLVPRLAKLFSFGKVSLISGIIWAVWHLPALIFTDYGGTSPLAYRLAMFTLLVLAFSFFMAWLRLRSGSVWTAALAHSSHNVFILHIFQDLTVVGASTMFFVGEEGLFTVIVVAVLAFVFWRLGVRQKLGE